MLVALLAEGVDRNQSAKFAVRSTPLSPSSRRAWIEIESKNLHKKMAGASPSSRRAWIEIRQLSHGHYPFFVALLAEGVDRNLISSSESSTHSESPSSRRAWIEIEFPEAREKRVL